MVVSLFHLLQFGPLKKKLPFFFILYLFWFIFFLFSFQEEQLADGDPIREGTVFVRFSEFPFFDGNQMRGTVKAQNGERWFLRYWIEEESEKEKWMETIRPGYYCQVKGILTTPEGPRNPNAFNYKRHLLSEKIRYIFQADTIFKCVEGKKTMIDSLLILRQEAIKRAADKVPETVAAFMNALLFGDKSLIGQNLLESYQKLGISHLLAISGLHVSIFTTLLYFLLIRLGLKKETVRRLLLVFLPAYAVLAGGAPSVNRAVFMGICLLLFSQRRNNIHPIDGLGLSFILFIIYNPYLLYHPGFQLSYLVTAVLLFSRNLFQTLQGKIRPLIAVSFIAQVASMPILLLHFYEISLLSFLLNILYVPLYSSVVLPLCLLCFGLMQVPFLNDWISGILNGILLIANKMALLFADFTVFTITLGKPPIIIFLIYILIILTIFVQLERKSWRSKNVYFLFMIPVFMHLACVKWSPIGEIVFLDVGQGDSIVIKLPFNKGNYVIDTGGVIDFPKEKWMERARPYDPGERVVLPFLKSKGITKLDALILTHGDADHIGGAKALINNIKIRNVLVGATVEKSNLEMDVIQSAYLNGGKVVEAREGERWTDGGYDFYILSPPEGTKATNNASIVILTEIGQYRFLFTGDLEKEGEERLLDRYPNLKVDVLKVGHHGSRTSTTPRFVETIQPEVAIISAGKNNRFNHPHPEVLEILEKSGVSIFRTDKHGAITFRFFLKKGFFSIMKN